MFYRRPEPSTVSEHSRLRHSHINDLLQLHPQAKPLNVDRSAFSLPCTFSTGTFQLNIVLGAWFPERAPVIQLVFPHLNSSIDSTNQTRISHRYADSSGSLIHHPKLQSQSWTPHSSLGTTVTEILKDLTAYPPTIEHTNNSNQLPARQASPPLATVSSSLNPTSSSSVSSSHTVPSSSSSVNPAQTAPIAVYPVPMSNHQGHPGQSSSASPPPPPPRPANTSVRLMSLQNSQQGVPPANPPLVSQPSFEIPVPSSHFPILDGLSIQALEDLYQDVQRVEKSRTISSHSSKSNADDKNDYPPGLLLQQIINDTDRVKDLNGVKETIRDQILELNISNTKKREQLQEQNAQLSKLREQIEAETARHQLLYTQAQQIQSYYTLSRTHHLLDQAIKEADEQSEQTKAKIEQGELNFMEQYLKERTQFHERSAKKERLYQIYGKK